MQDPVEPGSGTPQLCQSILECEVLVGTPSRRALWPAVMRTAATGRTHGRTDQPAEEFNKTLANGEPSTHGTSRK
jgi:hypothetical protein